MRIFLSLSVTLWCLSTSMIASAQTALMHWPAAAAAKIEAMIAKNRNLPDRYAVFDMDNTTYQNDLEEALLPYLENKGILKREDFSSDMIIIPFEDHQGQKESLYSYYQRLCGLNYICTPWIARAFGNLSLKEVKGYVDELLALKEPVNTAVYRNGQYQNVSVTPPRVTPGMQELFKTLQANGIKVYIITAAHEELVRMVASDPRYGYNVPASQVIGINTLLKNPQTGEFTTSRWQISQGRYNPKANENFILTNQLASAITSDEGKLAAIYGQINQWQRPVLAAGDTAHADGFMLLNGPDLSKGGLRIWVNRSDQQTAELHQWREKAAKAQQKLGETVNANENWIEVTPAQLR